MSRSYGRSRLKKQIRNGFQCFISYLFNKKRKENKLLAKFDLWAKGRNTDMPIKSLSMENLISRLKHVIKRISYDLLLYIIFIQPVMGFLSLCQFRLNDKKKIHTNQSLDKIIYHHNSEKILSISNQNKDDML